ncbi:hypothetical protein RchiOBHm_Chr2g0096241 [Rosa chinensis]|uniref:Uncharacterized protein n=1 Tax=Rosa chinensis TaxID=74649 RepID=A0A2P6RL16_ROSCH|nr:hypothetical protein RchiOBHm_Chr2g0096241 [Rosa chinensis]
MPGSLAEREISSSGMISGFWVKVDWDELMARGSEIELDLLLDVSGLLWLASNGDEPAFYSGDRRGRFVLRIGVLKWYS